MKYYGFPPLIDHKSRVLVLGTMPGKKSLEKQQYYADPRNKFWDIMFSILKKQDVSEYTKKTKILLESGIALWDVLASCQRVNSGDNNITHLKANDFARASFLNTNQ